MTIGAHSPRPRATDPGAGNARALLVVILLGVAVRVALGVSRGPALLEAGNGLYFMDELAKSLVAGRGYALDGVPSVFHQPGYVFALAAGYGVAGAGWHGVLAASVVIGAAQVWLTARIASRLLPAAAVPAAVLAAVHPVLVWHGLSVADTTLFSVTLLGWLDATLAAMRDRRVRHVLLAGLWLGLAALTRPSLGPLAPLGVIAVGLAAASWRRALAFAAATAGIAFLVALPWLLRNHELTGRFPLVGTHGPESVWAANSPGADEVTWLDSTYDEVSWRQLGNELDIRALQSALEPDEAVRREAVFRAATTEWIRANPWTFTKMTALRLMRIWDVRYHPTRRGTQMLPGARSRTLVHATVQIPVLALALAGCVLLWRGRDRRLELALLVALLAAYSASHAIGAGYTRVRLPVDPLLVALAAVAIASVADRLRGRRAAVARA